MLSLLSRRVPDLIASMLSWGGSSPIRKIFFYNRLTGVCLDWRCMAGGHAQRCLRHDGRVVMIFCCFVWLAWKKSDNATLEKGVVHAYMDQKGMR